MRRRAFVCGSLGALTECLGVTETSCEEYPTVPGTLSERTVDQFVEDYERTFIQDRSEEKGGSASVGTFKTEVKPEGDGYLAHALYSVSVEHDGTVADRRFTVAYFVGQDTVLRARIEGKHSDRPDPIEEGSTPDCLGK